MYILGFLIIAFVLLIFVSGVAGAISGIYKGYKQNKDLY